MTNYLKEFMQNVRIADLVDIGIIATFIYLILVWFKKARARFMLLGMLILGSVYILARLFGLYLTTMVFQAFFAIFFIIIVVIFQDDFRHMFERIAIWGMTRKYRRKISFVRDTNILSGAIANLARKQSGALVVIRGRDPLDRYLEAGNNLDALLNQVLLESIFDPHVPSHDGAVIIEENRITKFGCHLPLSTNIQEVGQSGTRHAAALGLSERADALCIVVSEEQGTVSVAREGRLIHLNEAADLHNILEDFYRTKFPEKRKSALRDFLTGHFLEKIFAIILACTIWLVFGHRIETVRRDFVVPVEYRNLTREWIINEPTSRQVTATLSGSERAFNLLEPKELKLSLDMSQIKDGENNFTLNKDLLRYPAGLSIVNLNPSEIKLTAYRMVPLNIPVELKTEGRAAPGVNIREIKVEPKEISAGVPSIITKDKLTITTEPIDLKTITETTVLTPKLIIPSDLRFPGDKPPQVKVTVEVEKKE
ncbi:MAG: diadenylate cyclase [Candidatus Omnitrophota bacterium]|jgi:uncharacterized protein (TIGR00159 family)